MKTKVLFIDDDTQTLQLMKRVSSFLGYDAITTSNVAEGESLIEREHPDLVMVDLQMKGMNGIEFITQMRKKDISNKIPVVILSAEKTRQQVDDAKKAGANGFFLKPVPLDEMTRIIRHFTENKHKTRKQP